ncbi:MAG: sugar-binding domain-containing protein, partial [Candidatus Eiseniibacteriota bacterium]
MITGLEEIKRSERVAVLLCEGYSHQEIADILNVAPATVGRDRKKAVNDGVLGPTRPTLIMSHEKREKILLSIDDPDPARRLERRLKSCEIGHIRVVRTGRDARETARRVSVAAAGSLEKAVSLVSREIHRIGLTWGMHLRTLIDSAHLPEGQSANIRLVPLSGEISFVSDDARFERARRYASNRLVHDLAWRLGLPVTHAHWLNAPAMIARSFLGRPRDLAIAWELIENDPTVRAILGIRNSRLQHRRGAVARVGTLLTGIGALGVDSISSDFGIFEFSAEELEALRAEGIVGDINGHLIHASGEEVPRQSMAGQHNQLAVGASPLEMRRIADRRRHRSHYPGLGVVLVAAGAHKA